MSIEFHSVAAAVVLFQTERHCFHVLQLLNSFWNGPMSPGRGTKSKCCFHKKRQVSDLVIRKSSVHAFSMKKHTTTLVWLLLGNGLKPFPHIILRVNRPLPPFKAKRHPSKNRRCAQMRNTGKLTNCSRSSVNVAGQKIIWGASSKECWS